MSAALGPIAIIGMGSGGHAMAADLLSRGHDVRALIESDREKVDALNKSAEIRTSGLLGTRQVAIPRVAHDAIAASDCRWLMVTTTADAHARVAELLSPVLRADQVVVLHTGYVGGSAVFRQALDRTRPMPTVCETNTLLYSAFSVRPGEVHVNGLKRWVELAAADPSTAAAIVQELRPAFPQLVAGTDELANGLNNPNPVTHTPILLTHFAVAEAEWGWRDAAQPLGGFFHLADHITPAVARLQLALESERVTLMRALGLEAAVIGRDEFSSRSYGPGSKEPSSPRVGPTFQRRFLHEDLPCGLVPMEALAKRAGLDVPAMSGVITIMGRLVGTDFRAIGRQAGIVAPASAFRPTRHHGAIGKVSVT